MADSDLVIRYKGEHEDIKIQCVNTYERVVENWKDNPDDILLVNTPDDRQVTCRQMSELIDGVSRDMSLSGVGRGSVVSLWCGNCMQIPVIVLSAWRLGAAVAMIGASLTIEEAKREIDMVETSFLFVDEEREKIAHKGVFDPTRAKTVLTLDGKKVFEMPIKTRQVSRVSAGSDDIGNDTAVMLFSSGTTGRPKAVELSHKNMNYFLHINSPEVVGRSAPPSIHFLPLTHFYGFGLMLNCLNVCTPIILLPRFNLEEYVRLVEKHQITVMFLVPPVVVMMTQRPDIMRKYDLSCVLGLFCAAAPISLSLTNNLVQYLPNLLFTRFKQGYGMTETTGGVTRSPTQLTDKDPVGSVGKAIPTVEIKVVDELTRRNCGPNVHGEIAVRTPLVMKGYYKNDEATAHMIDQHGWLYTGDIGYYDDDGFLYIVDRAKELLKCRGNQVAPAELEDVLLSHPEITDAAVVGLPDELAGELPLAFVVRTHNGSVSDKQLQDFVAERVAPYKRLSGGVRFVESIPKLASGKILRRQLRDSVRRQAHKL